jgi:hypothetical protein
MHSPIVCPPPRSPYLTHILASQPIRPMPRAYDQIVAILDRFKVVRDNLNTLNANLQQVAIHLSVCHIIYP